VNAAPLRGTLPWVVRACLLISFLLAAGPAQARRFAIVAGNNQGGSDLDSLRFAESDARRMSEVLTGLAGFAASDVQLITPCDSAGLEKALQGMRARFAEPGAGLDGMFLFYYSGHSDRGGLRLGDKVYPLEKLRDNFSSVPSQVKIGIFDACQSGMFTRFKGGSSGKPITLESLKNIQGQVIIASSAMDEKSQESDHLQSSIFTHHWLNGLRGSGDMNGDRRVTLNEGYQYAYNMTIQTTSRTRWGIQHPAYQFKIHGEGDIVLADLNLGRSGLVFKGSHEGKYLIMDRDQEHIVADFYKPVGKDLLISLKGGDYRVLKVERDQWRVADAKVPAEKTADFEPATLKTRSQVVNPIKGRLEGEYHVAPGPVEQHGLTIGATRKWGASLKLGEGTGGIGGALIHNWRPDLQLQLGGSYLGGRYSPLQPVELIQDFYIGSYFGLLRKYEGVYFIDGGLNVKTTRASITENDIDYAKTGWEAGIPVHVGIELGPRRSIFATLYVGNMWVLTGGGDSLEVSTPSGSRTDDSGLSFGLALGMYVF
jgi:hypothetical protein